MERGYIKSWRKTIDNGMMRNHALFTFWHWCLYKAAWKQQKVVIGFQEVLLEPGQFIFGRNSAASELGLSPQNVRTCLNSLKSTNRITIKSTSKFSVISVINWHTYQGCDSPINQQTNQQTNKPLTSNQPATNHKEEVKEVKELTTTPTLPGVCVEPVPVAVKVRKSARPKKETDPDVGELTKLFAELYTVKTNGLAFRKYGAIGEILKRLKIDYHKDNIEFAIRYYFSDDNNFMVGKNYTPSGFSNAFDIIAQKAQRGEI